MKRVLFATWALRDDTVIEGVYWKYLFMKSAELSKLWICTVTCLDRPVNVHMDHVAAVVDVDYSPTGNNKNIHGYSKQANNK